MCNFYEKVCPASLTQDQGDDVCADSLTILHTQIGDPKYCYM